MSAAVNAVGGESASVSGDGQQLMHQQYYQERIQRLERELEAVRRQASKQVDVSSSRTMLHSYFKFETIEARGYLLF